MTQTDEPNAPNAMTVQAVAVELPQHTGLTGLLEYRYAHPLQPGQLLRVPLGRRTVTGIAWQPAAVAAEAAQESEPKSPNSLARSVSLTAADPPAAGRPLLKPVSEVLTAIPPLSGLWMRLLEFGASYYQRALGELALSVLPPELRKLDARQLAQRRTRWLKDKNLHGPESDAAKTAPTLPELTKEQQAACDALEDADERPSLLFGVTGSGKTEVYLRAAQRALDSGRQVLVLVPEINLTPQLEAQFAQRFPGERLVSLHSGLTPARRLQSWVLAHEGQARLILGTRLAIFASLPQLGLIVVDEEHDPSFKQQDGARYSARDLAVYRGALEHVRVVLGSATPSLESWQRAREGRYRRIDMPSRVGEAAMPEVQLLDMGRLPRVSGTHAPVLAPPLLRAIEERMARGEQSLLLLNRRGYAPVLHCSACGWKSQCAHCSAWRVFHKADRTLRCHHCGFTERVPRACPDCGNLDIAPIGRGTEKLEEQVAGLLPQARIARIDADSTRLKGSLDSQLAAVHAGEVDVLVGTQMITKGHDFRRITLVAAVNPDGALFASDFRAVERLFALLLQAAGRAGRDAQAAQRSEMWLQTWHPRHPVYAALKRHDYPAFAEQQLHERHVAGLPPFVHLALVRVDARISSDAAAFLRAAAAAAVPLPDAERVVIFPPVPPPIARVADVERMQMLVESASRPALQRFLQAWHPVLQELRAEHKGVLRWAVDVDPLGI